MDEANAFTLTLQQLRDFVFRVQFDWPDAADRHPDEPASLGRASGPDAARLIGAGGTA